MPLPRFRFPAAVIIGSEGKGVTEQALRLSDQRVIIPMKGRAESLNAGVAAAIVIYEMTNEEAHHAVKTQLRLAFCSSADLARTAAEALDAFGSPEAQ